MFVELTIEDLKKLVKGSSPSFKAMDNIKIKYKGEYNDYRGTWIWEDSALDNLSEEQLYEIYIICKNSWEQQDAE